MTGLPVITDHIKGEKGQQNRTGGDDDGGGGDVGGDDIGGDDDDVCYNYDDEVPLISL